MLFRSGHHDCGGVKASLEEDNPDLIDHWIRPIRKYYQRAQDELEAMDYKDRVDRLCEINVVEQVRNICHIPAVRKAWRKGQELSIHGFIYNLKDGRLHDLNVSVSDIEAAEKVIIREDE